MKRQTLTFVGGFVVYLSNRDFSPSARVSWWLVTVTSVRQRDVEVCRRREDSEDVCVAHFHDWVSHVGERIFRVISQ